MELGERRQEETCWAKIDHLLWKSGELPRNEKAVNHIRAGNLVS